ncbi:carnitine operon protein CaiE, partial [Salmonella enterica subsp. salamae]|nr:carnitine operon protein CaiE [Salmonella enterica subsp. salamae]
MSYYAFEGLIPVVHPDAFVHPSAVLIGDVIVGAGVYIGPLASLRGDYGRLILEAGSNLQDGCIMHGYCDTDTIVHENGHIGHGAILHGCVVGRDALVGMNSVIMDGAVIGEESIVAAMSFVKAGFQGKARQLLVGSPARVLRQVTDQ